MKQKKTNSSTKSKKPAKRLRGVESKESVWLEDYLDCFSFKMKPITQAFVHRISQELVAWAENDDIGALKVSSFYLKKGISYETWSQWRKKYKEIDHAHKYSTMVIGNRREEGAIRKKFDAGTVNYTMPMYDPEWKELIEWRAKLKEEEKDSGGTKIVILDKIPETPPLKDE